jgi:hypothetical protein
MQSIFSSTEREDASAPQPSLPEIVPPAPDQPFDFNADEPVPAPAAKEFVMGPRQMASLAFVGVLIIGIMSAVAYFAGRRNNTPEPPQRVTERVIERVVQAKAPPVPTPVVAAPTPAPAPPIAKAVQTPAPPAPAPVQHTQPQVAQVTTPVLNQMYLQLGSVDIGIAQVMVEGLRQRGIPSIVGTGISKNVARVLVGPFTSAEQQRAAQKQIEDLGFKPFQRSFTEHDLQQPSVADPAKAPKQP